jgi:hypothetical protein
MELTDDYVASQRVYKAIDELNAALGDAARAELRVDIEINEMRETRIKHARVFCDVNISKDVPR